jgi:hypothetical protein
VERSDTHQLRFAEMMAFAKGLNPSYRVLCRRLQHCSAMEYDCKGFDWELPA